MILAVTLSLIAFLCSHCSNAQSSCPCLAKSQFVAALQAKGTVHCYNAVNNLTSIGLSGTPKRIIPVISKPIDMIQVGNDVYITARTSRLVYRFDQDGNQLEVIQLTPSTAEPKFLVLHDNKIYISTKNPGQILVSSDINNGHPLSFSRFLDLGTLDPNEIQFTPDGNQVIVGTSNSRRFNVYNTSDLSLAERRIDISTSNARDIQLDAFGNVYISTVTDTIKVYSPEYEFIRDITYPNTQEIDGFIIQCDGSKLLIDAAHQILLTDRDDNIVDRVTIQGLTHATPLRNILFTTNGNVFVVNHFGDQVFVY